MAISTDAAQIIQPSFGNIEDSSVEDRLPDSCIDPYAPSSFSKELIQLRWEVSYWRSRHQDALKREAKLKEKIAELEAKLRLRERQLFARKSEKKAKDESGPSKTDKEKKPRGQQQGSKGHGRRDNSHLPGKEETHDIPEDEKVCPCCGLPLEPFPGTEDSEQIEIKVKAHRRIIKRKRYKPTCHCGAVPGIVTAPPAPKLIPKGLYGISVWGTILLDKFLFLRPTNRLLEDLKTLEINIAQGTITDGLKTIAPLFDPIFDALYKKNLEDDRWHADETRWLVFASLEGKVGYRWYMWVFRSPSTVVYKLDPSRSSAVPKAHFGTEAKGILLVDRYSAYKAMVKINGIILAFCWSHVRRDFLGMAKDWPQQEAWAMEWVEAIGHLYHLNALRLEILDDPETFAKKDQDLRDAIEKMERQYKAERDSVDIHPARRKVLESLKNHWEGLTVFVDHPEVPMDNNEAERLERHPAVARKIFYGSGSLWSGQLTAVLFSIFQTLRLWNINPRKWLTNYLEVCAANQGKPPENIHSFLPWKMSDEQRKIYSLEPEPQDSS
jgi:transposase